MKIKVCIGYKVKNKFFLKHITPTAIFLKTKKISTFDVRLCIKKSNITLKIKKSAFYKKRMLVSIIN